MRIIGYIEHPVMKITVFKMDNKISVKFENALYEQTYKFRDSEQLNGIEDVQRLVDDTFVAQVLAELPRMHHISQAALGRVQEEADNEFEEII